MKPRRSPRYRRLLRAPATFLRHFSALRKTGVPFFERLSIAAEWTAQFVR